MKAIVIRDWIEPEAFALEEIADPRPGPGEILIAVDTAAVTFGDVLVATGRYQVRPHLPFTPGNECAGVVEAVGAGVVDYRPGDRVATLGFKGNSRRDRAILGVCAEKLVAPLRNVARVPDNIGLEQAAVFRASNETSYYALQRGRLIAGETLLVLGAGGATGYAAIEIGKMMGAHVIGSASSEAKRAIARAAGADETVDSNDPDWRGTIAALTGGRGVDVVFDPVGDSQTERAFRSLGYGGRLLVVGFAAGTIPRIPANLALMKSASLVGVNLLTGWERDPDHIAANAAQLMEWLAMDKLSVPPIARRYALRETGAAFADVAAGTTAGRVVVSVRDQPRGGVGLPGRA